MKTTAAVIATILFIILVIIALIMIAWILKGNETEDKLYNELNEMDNEH